MKNKNTIFSQSYKIGLTVFLVLVTIVSVITITLVGNLDGCDFLKKSEVKQSLEITNNTDTVYVEKIKRVVEVDTLYISCKKKHCEEVHTTNDTLK